MTCFRRTLALLTVGMAAPALCGTLRVPSEYATINAGLDAASPGDTVLVAPGTYSQFETRLLGGAFWSSAVAFLREDITLASEQGPFATTLRLDGPTPGFPSVLRAHGEVGTATVRGFTVTGTSVDLNGLAYTWGDRCVSVDCVFRDLADGRGISSTAADLEVYGCRFEDIASTGIAQSTGTLLVEDSEFVNCRRAIQARDDEHPHATGFAARRSRFTGSLAEGTGGAVFVGGYSTSLIEDCWFESNRTETGSAVGGALYAFGPSVVVRSSTFIGNSARIRAGAAAIGGSTVLAEGNTFWGNWSEVNWPSEGGSAVFFESAGEFRNNVIAGSHGDEAVGLREGSGAVLTSCNVFWGNAQGDAVFPLSATDVAVDPLLCDPDASDFRVHAGSPCLPGSGHPACGTLIGAWGEGCGTVGVEARSWGRVKGDYRTESR